MTSLPQHAIDISNLHKTYKGTKKAPAKVALSDVSFGIERGSIFGLLGPNGAGKSTIINILAGLVRKTSGSVRVWGHDIDSDERQVKASIGVVPQEINYDPFFSPRELLDLQAGMYGVRRAERRTMEILETVGLSDKADAYTRNLSGGMLRRLMVAKAMVHFPPILVLDEPTAGVDVELRKQLWENVRALNKDHGVTVILTTHYLEEAEELCDKIAIINHGAIVALEDKDDLIGRLDHKEIRFRFDQTMDGVPPALEGYNIRQSGARSLSICYSPAEQMVGAMIEDLQKAGLRIVDISTDESYLEDVFVQLTA